METLKLLSLGAIALAVSACVVVYILHRRTTARLDALTQANMGITHTLHQLVASSMPRPQSQLQAQGQHQPQSALVPSEGGNTGENARIVVSDDESSGTDSSESVSVYDGTEDEASDTWNDKNDSQGRNDDDSDDESDNEGKREITIKQQDKVQYVPQVAERVEELSDEETDGEESDESGSESDSESDGESDDESADGQGKIELTGGDVVIESDEINVNSVDDGFQSGKDTHTDSSNVDLVAFLLPQKDDKNIDIGIMPVSSNQKGMMPYEGSKPIPDGFKQMKVEELRKLIVSKLGMTDDEAKKLKKPQLIQKLSESHG